MLWSLTPFHILPCRHTHSPDHSSRLPHRGHEARLVPAYRPHHTGRYTLPSGHIPKVRPQPVPAPRPDWLVYHANARVLRRVCIADFPASVTGTVVHQNQTEVLKGLVQDALDTLPQISLRVIDRDHNTDFLFCRHFLYPSVRAFFLIYAVSSRPAGMHSAVRNGLGDSRT